MRWIIIAVIIVAGLFFWMKSGKKDNQVDISENAETSAQTDQTESSAETEASAEQAEETSSDREKTM